MGEVLGQIGMQAAGAAIGGIGGQIFGAMNDRRQLKQQKALTAMQMNADKEMTAYNKDVQMQMWRDTSYGPQKEQMEKAGINPALMYGMGGGGGQTANISSGNVGGGRASGNTGENVAMAGMGMMGAAQLRLLEAQKENIEADTENKKVDAGYTSGAKTENTKQDTEVKSNESYSQILANSIKNFMLSYNVKGEKVNLGEGDIATENAKRDLEGKRIGQEISLAKNEREEELNEAQINKIAVELAQGWEDLDLEGRKTRVAEIRAEYDLNPSWDKLFNTMITSSGKIFDVIGKGRKGAIQSTWKPGQYKQYQKK